MNLHAPICLGFQFFKNVTFCAFSTPFLTLHSARSVNALWPLQFSFDTTFGISSTKFEVMGITTNSLRSRANPVCLSFVNQECAVGYESTYDAMESGLFQVLSKLRLCKSKAKCEMCDAVREQVEQGPMQELLTPPPPSPPSKRAKGVSVPARRARRKYVFSLPLKNAMCDNTTKFSKFIIKRKPHLRNKILQCAAHLTGISWQKRTHFKYFKDPAVYRQFYKIVVKVTRCSSVELGSVLHRKLVLWLRENGEPRAADWFERYWTGDRGNFMKAHGGVGGTNNNCGIEGRWGGFKKAVCGTAGSTSSLSMRTAVPSTLRYLQDVSKEQASYWAKDTRERASVCTAKFTFPQMPHPIREDWSHLELMHPWSLELAILTASHEVKDV